jgi:hypothetical protein
MDVCGEVAGVIATCVMRDACAIVRLVGGPQRIFDADADADAAGYLHNGLDCLWSRWRRLLSCHVVVVMSEGDPP